MLLGLYAWYQSFIPLWRWLYDYWGIKIHGKKRVPNWHTSIGRIHGVHTCLSDTLVRNAFSLCKVCQLGTRFFPCTNKYIVIRVFCCKDNSKEISLNKTSIQPLSIHPIRVVRVIRRPNITKVALEINKG
jgi:hypothetical protein